MARRPSQSAPASGWHASSVWALMGFAGLVLVTIGLRRLPAWVAGLNGLLSLLTFTAYALDKRAARQGRWRVAEAKLLWLGLLGGWPGAVLAQEMLRHKSSKARFRAWFWVTVLVNVLAFVVLLTLRPFVWHFVWPALRQGLGL